MKQGIHGFLCDHTVLGKLVVLFRLEIPVEGFQISEFIGAFHSFSTYHAKLESAKKI